MPAARACSRDSSKASAVSAMIGTRPRGAGNARIARAALKPSMPGMCRSISTMSKSASPGCAAIACNAPAPSAHITP